MVEVGGVAGIAGGHRGIVIVHVSLRLGLGHGGDGIRLLLHDHVADVVSIRLLGVVELVADDHVAADHLILDAVPVQRRLVRRDAHHDPRHHPQGVHKVDPVGRADVLRRDAEGGGVRHIGLPAAGKAVPPHGNGALAAGRLRGDAVPAADLVDAVHHRVEEGLGRLVKERLELGGHRRFAHHRAPRAQHAVEVHVQHLPGVFVGQVDDVGLHVGVVLVGEQPGVVVALQIVLGGVDQHRDLLVRAGELDGRDAGVAGGNEAPVALHLGCPAVGHQHIHHRDAGGRVGEGGVAAEGAAVIRGVQLGQVLPTLLRGILRGRVLLPEWIRVVVPGRVLPVRLRNVVPGCGSRGAGGWPAGVPAAAGGEQQSRRDAQANRCPAFLHCSFPRFRCSPVRAVVLSGGAAVCAPFFLLTLTI